MPRLGVYSTEARAGKFCRTTRSLAKGGELLYSFHTAAASGSSFSSALASRHAG